MYLPGRPIRIGRVNQVIEGSQKLIITGMAGGKRMVLAPGIKQPMRFKLINSRLESCSHET